MRVRIVFWMIAAALSVALPAAGSQGLAIDPKTCLGCHGDSIAAAGFSASVHGSNGCTSCHAEITDIKRHGNGEVAIKPVDCSGCHKSETAEHGGSVHAENGVECIGCHTQIHTQTRWGGDKKAVSVACAECHDTSDYEASIHAQGVRAGNPDAPTCTDCHQLHAIAKIGEASSQEARALHTKVCVSCHADEAMMERNEVFPIAVGTFMESYHGKSYELGFPEQVAGCSDCHMAHKVLPEEDPASSLHPDNLVTTCSACHPKASTQFTKFYSHGDHADRANYPILYYTYISMTGLLVGTFAVFWLHTLLWMFRGFIENREKERALARGEHGHAIPDGHKQYMRFQMRHIFLHLTVIISFLGLSLTGLPLKFADQAWAHSMMAFYGGVEYAGLIHRGCAILTFYYFLAAIIMSFDFLFVRKDIKAHWLHRLFGPESLMPNFRDLKDIAGMVRWFFFRGPKPSFDRWTYWEKFDFLAVFWGMFAIGGSGLLLWFPEFFGQILPGWTFNVATIVHSDEALLATGFIFTVHFFNTHGRPEKFPMDFVIFNGQMSKEEFIEERADQWKRYEQLGITEEFLVRRPSGALYDFLFKGFGFLALFTGLALAFLMLYGFITG